MGSIYGNLGPGGLSREISRGGCKLTQILTNVKKKKNVVLLYSQFLRNSFETFEIISKLFFFLEETFEES